MGAGAARFKPLLRNGSYLSVIASSRTTFPLVE
jgi:hypothetical protein